MAMGMIGDMAGGEMEYIYWGRKGVDSRNSGVMKGGVVIHGECLVKT